MAAFEPAEDEDGLDARRVDQVLAAVEAGETGAEDALG